ncbi:MAG: AAA family ATPase [Candidatus Pacebacteria bacterium]|nr:AAA family ATPase [Candidatus Paceibacterota bacterium]
MASNSNSAHNSISAHSSAHASISRLKSLEINGFKSFAKKGSLVFNSAITSIVGPNGSGKSNVAESFRFVLGEQSIKSMRGKKGEDLIFNGGKDSPRANRASVKVVFDNTNRMFNIDFDEVSIERVVHRDSVNEYFINGTSVRLKDVAELLAHANIGSSGHHIISQGEADRLLSAIPRERREMIEDALGLKVYQYKKDESEKKLEKTAVHMKEIESLRREIAPHIKFLRKQVEKIEKSVALRGELTGLYQEYFARENQYLVSEKAQLTSQKHAPTEELHELQKELSHHKNILDAAKHNLGEAGKSSELFKLESEIQETRKKKDLCVREIGRLEGEISYLKRVIDKKLKEASETVATDTKQVYLREVETVTKEVEIKVAVAVEYLTGSGDATHLAIEARIDTARTLLGEIKETLHSFVQYHKHGSRTSYADTGSAEHESGHEVANPVEVEESEIERIGEEMKILEARLGSFSTEEQDQAKRYADIKLEIDKDKDKNVESEKAVLRIMSKQNELHSHIEIIKAKEERVRIEEEDFKRELQEASMLVGRDAVHYEAYDLTAVIGVDASGVDGMDGSVAGPASDHEPRQAQLDRRRQIEKNKIRLEEMGGSGGDEVMREYKDAEDRDAFFAKELVDLATSSDALKALITELNTKLDELFKEGIGKINKEFNKFFGLMFGGGSAELKLVKEEKRKKRKGGDDGLDDLSDVLASSKDTGTLEATMDAEPVEEGIDIHVSLPHKRIKGLTMLSGGERALTSIALLFAMSQVNPPPFVILDETDAALDEANSKKYGDMIEALSQHSQLILITHNRETMSRAGVIYGVTMGGEGYSKLLSIAFDEAVAVAK